MNLNYDSDWISRLPPQRKHHWCMCSSELGYVSTFTSCSVLILTLFHISHHYFIILLLSWHSLHFYNYHSFDVALTAVFAVTALKHDLQTMTQSLCFGPTWQQVSNAVLYVRWQLQVPNWYNCKTLSVVYVCEEWVK